MKTVTTHYNERAQCRTKTQGSMGNYAKALNRLLKTALSEGAHSLHLSWDEKDGFILVAERKR